MLVLDRPLTRRSGQSWTRVLCTSGACEPLKAAVHTTAGLLAAVMATYNAVAWRYRGDPHLAFNAILYTCLTVWEVQRIAGHCQRRTP